MENGLCSKLSTYDNYLQLKRNIKHLFVNPYLNLLVVFLYIIYILCINKTQHRRCTRPIPLIVIYRLIPESSIIELNIRRNASRPIIFPDCESLKISVFSITTLSSYIVKCSGIKLFFAKEDKSSKIGLNIVLDGIRSNPYKPQLNQNLDMFKGEPNF